MLHTTQQRQQLDKIRDEILKSLGTRETIIPDHTTAALTWRKPLRIDEINKMAPTPEVRARPGRP